MRLKGVLQPFIKSIQFQSIKKNMEKEKYPIGIDGLSESSKAYLAYSIFQEENKSMLIVASNDVEAKNIHEDLSLFTTSAYYFPTKAVVFYNVDAVSGDLRYERLKIIKEMLSKDKKIIVTSIEALTTYYSPIEIMKSNYFYLSLEDEVNVGRLSQKLVESGYERVDIVENKGQFSIRGGIIDIFSPTSSMPHRIELFGDEIDSIRTFNVESQRSIERVEKVEIFPAREIVLSKEIIDSAIAKITTDFEKSKNSLQNKEDKGCLEKISSIININIESLKERGTFETIDSYLNYFYEKPSTLIDYLENPLIILDDTQRCMGKLESTYFEFLEDFNSFLDRGDILPGQGNLLIPKEELYTIIENTSLITLNAFAKSYSNFVPKSIVTIDQITLHSYHGKLDLLIDDILDKKQRGYNVVILCGTRPRGERLVETLKDKDIESVYKDKIESFEDNRIIVTFGNQLKGYEFPGLKLSIISDKEVFGAAAKKKQKKKAVKGVGKIKSFSELKPGDYVVHVNHGIGVYKGIKQLEIQNVTKDYLEITYTGEDTLYVPAEQLDLVQKYIGTEGKTPKVNKLGGSEWQKAKNKVRTSINEIAEDLVKLYSARAAIKGYSYSVDTTWQKQFEEEFPFEETPDQLTAIEEIKKDMEDDKPMDRLLCGDVGYGKTEVAIRAAFKAVMDGKQVAFLVPTTILAEQHYKNFVQRFSDFPVKIDMISRFRSAVQQKNTLKATKEGNVDIIIGTHKLLSKAVDFKDLGLLIIDEEQRFGVSHKEKIKNLKKNIDVLTLTATPIPRTLHMSLTGVRGISVIETPPEERYPVQTYVTEYNDQLIRDAIMREVNRGGQVFFVYNRVESIVEMAEYLRDLLPEVKIIVAHGQMGERELEQVMLDFMKGEAQILLATTIIETGIDIQNCNTIIIYDSDKMGLSQLYQLRGRVGRTNRIAYAYLTYKKDKILSEAAEKRLKAIKEFTELGSGFKIAMRDLEIRGAGNLMGSAQHGHMATIGYDLYCKMLEDTIKIIKGEIDKAPVETVIEMKVDAYIPNSYIDDEVQKIEVYKKIASIESKEELLDVRDELLDRFSDIPDTVNNLMEIAYIRTLTRKIGIVEVKDKFKTIEMTFESKDRITESLVKGILNKHSKDVTFNNEKNPIMIFSLKQTNREGVLEKFKEFIEYLISIVER